MIYTIENNFIRFALDENARLLELRNLETNHNYAGNEAIWEIFAQAGEDREAEISSGKSVPSITVDGCHMRIEYGKLHLDGRNLNCFMVFDITLEKDEIRCRLEMKNEEPDIVISEVHFPRIRKLNDKKSQSFIWSELGGEKHDDVRPEIRQFHTKYKACDQNGIQMSSIYPGTYLALNCFMFADNIEGLYFGSHDPTFQNTLHLLKLENDTDLSAAFVKYPHLSKGMTVNIDGYVLSPYSGTWHCGAGKYRKWIGSWSEHEEAPEWVRKLNGWQRIILKHQYGKTHYKYEDLPQIFKDGAAAGINSLFLFGWTKGGHDNNYPEYEYDDAQGGAEKLKQEVSAFQNSGGRVILYFNGRIVDTKSSFYRENGERLCIKDPVGYTWLEQYPFSGNGTATRIFDSKTFAAICPSSPEWLDVLKKLVAQSIELGADSVFFDQMGISEKICHSKSHGHETPCVNPVFYKARMLKTLRAIVKKHNPQMAIGIEALSDVTAQYADFVHGLTGGFLASKTGKVPGFLDFFRYVFPEIIISDRDIRDDNDIERRVNYSVLEGLRSDIEIYRCRKTIAETPHYSRYLEKINGLRQKYSEFLLEGTYCDTEGFTLLNDNAVLARRFQNGNNCAIVMTQNTQDKAVDSLNVPGYRYVKSDHIGDFSILKQDSSDIKIEIGKNAIALIILEKDTEKK